MGKKMIWFAVVVLTLIFVIFILRINEDSWICTDAGWVKHGNPDLPAPTTLCKKFENKLILSEYLMNNISVISPIKEVLGGKFFITNLDCRNSNLCEVEYEDGHILLKASFNYSIGVEKIVMIENFKIIKEN